jgi:hypothetical protein
MLHHRGEAEPIAAGSRLRLDTSLRPAQPSRVGESNPMHARVPLLILRENSGGGITTEIPRSRRSGRGACARPDISSPQRVALAELTHVSEMSQGRVESSRETQRVATGSRPLARLRASLTRYGLDASLRRRRTSRVGETKPTGRSVSVCENEPTCPNCHKALAAGPSLGLDTGLAQRQASRVDETNPIEARLVAAKQRQAREGRVALAKRTQRRFRVAPAKRTQQRERAARQRESDYPLDAGFCRPEQA